ncbi:MAG: transposase [Candidatus Riflemargulisbacteria bacterium]
MRVVTTYDKEFKEQAVQMAICSNKKLKDVAGSLGIPSSTLRGWVESKEYTSISKEELSEIKRLKKELAEVRMERDILKKAMAVFSRQ